MKPTQHRRRSPTFFSLHSDAEGGIQMCEQNESENGKQKEKKSNIRRPYLGQMVKQKSINFFFYF